MLLQNTISHSLQTIGIDMFCHPQTVNIWNHLMILSKTPNPPEMKNRVLNVQTPKNIPISQIKTNASLSRIAWTNYIFVPCRRRPWLPRYLPIGHPSLSRPWFSDTWIMNSVEILLFQIHFWYLVCVWHLKNVLRSDFILQNTNDYRKKQILKKCVRGGGHLRWL